MGRALVDLRMPSRWVHRSFWSSKNDVAYGFVVAFSWMNWSAGIELIGGSSKGVAIIIGPFWIGLARRPFDAPSLKDTPDDR